MTRILVVILAVAATFAALAYSGVSLSDVPPEFQGIALILVVFGGAIVFFAFARAFLGRRQNTGNQSTPLRRWQDGIGRH